VTRDEDHAVTNTAPGQRNTDCRRRRDAGADAVDRCHADARRAQRVCLLAAPAEYKRIAAFQAHDRVARQRFRDHSPLDERLWR